MSDKVHAGHLSKSAKELFREGFKAFKEALKGAEGALSANSSLRAEASDLLGQTAPSLAELPKILFKLSKSTSVGAVITSPTGAELMANNAFYNLTRGGGGASGAASASTTALKLRKNAQGDEVEAPWLRAASSNKAIFERLYCGEIGEGNGQHLDFYCQPLLGAGGEFEGAFTLVSDSSLEVSRQEKLKELVGCVEGHIDNVKQAADELTQFLKSQGQSGALPVSAGNEDSSDISSIGRSSSNLSPSDSSSSASNLFDSPSSDSPSSDLSSSARPSPDSSSSDLSSSARPSPDSSLSDLSSSARPSPDSSLSDLSSSARPSPDSPLSDLSSSSLPRSTDESHGAADPESEFDPAQLQQAVDSASAFILDQESAGFAQAEEDEGPEDLWQEMSDGLAEVLNVEDSEVASAQDINMTILEEKPSKTRTISADKNNQPVFKDASGEPAACLVVDDIPVNQKLLVFQLKHFGLTIDTASSGSEALDLIAKNDYQIVFMDCDMPHLSGYDTTAEIRRRELDNGSKLPVIGMTSHDRDGDKQKCLRAGMNDALPKGVSESELRKAIATALGVVEVVKHIDGHENERSFDPQELEELISTFLYAMEMFVSSMQRAIDEKDSSLVRELASSVSGPSRVLGLHDMNKVGQEMVRLSSSGDWPQVRLKYLKLKTVYMRCQDDLRKLCPQAFSQVSAAH